MQLLRERRLQPAHHHKDFPLGRCLFPKGGHERELWWETNVLTALLINPVLGQILGKCCNEPAKHVVFRGNNKKESYKTDSLAKSLPENPHPAIIFSSHRKKRHLWLYLSPDTSLTAKSFKTPQECASHISQAGEEVEGRPGSEATGPADT